MAKTGATRKLKTARGNWPCPICGHVFRTRAEMYGHKTQDHHLQANKWKIVDGKRVLVSGHAWNKGLTIADERIQKITETKKQREYIPWNRGVRLSETHKLAISEGMKTAHKEKRAHNIGASRWNNEHSWPEKWFIKMLKNELGMVEHNDYKTEMPFDKYSLDFAWPEKKICIEIDGEQHERFADYKARDMAKDELLMERGWRIFRIKWKDCYNNPQKYINEVKNLF